MAKIYTHSTKVGPAKKAEGDRGNPWIHAWHYSDGTVRQVVVGALVRAPGEKK
jgi:hypothetical protein